MNGIRVWLTECWALPQGTPAEHQRLLLARQLRAHFTIAQPYAITNSLTAIALLAFVWPGPGAALSMQWIVGYVLLQSGWGLYARSRAKAMDEGRRLPARREVVWSTVWCALTAAGWAIGLVSVSRHIDEPGMLLLCSASTTGIMSTGAVVGFSVPVLSLAWLLVMLVGAYGIVLGMGYELQGATLLLVTFYAFVLMGAALFTSRQFVLRFRANLAADAEREVVSLLLGDFEQGARDWLWETDRAGLLTRGFGRLAEVLRRPEPALHGIAFPSFFDERRQLVVGSDREVGRAALAGRLAGGLPFANVVVECVVDDVSRSWSISAKPLHAPSGEWIGWRGVGSEVSDARAREADAIVRERQLDHLANHDALTGLPNRRAFMQWVEAAAPARMLALALIDLDNFKAVNDSLGHAAGDKVLCAVANRLQRMCDGDHRVARLGGDEFAILVQGIEGEEGEDRLLHWLQALLASMRIPEWVDGFRVDVRASIGVALPTGGRGDGGELLRHADTALYDAKNGGRDTFRLYRVEMSDRLRQRLAMVSDLAAAALGGQLALKYMALRRADDLSVHGYEALLRWNHPLHGEMSPVLFLPVAEESGLIDAIGLWVLERACRDALAWDASVSVCVNVSAVQLADPMLAAHVAGILQRVGFPASRLELEVTETAFVRDAATALAALAALREQGIGIAMDDFGVGYSSMAQLRLLPFDRIKLDMSFAQALLTERDADLTRTIIESVVRIAHARGVPVTVEGVEEPRQLEALRALGCTSVQGYLFGRPAPFDALPRGGVA